MPNRDGTGPRGLGMARGRRMGNCRANNTNDFPAHGYGNGYRNRGQERGSCSFNYTFNVGADELSELKMQAGVIENHLNGIKDRITELEAQQTQS